MNTIYLPNDVSSMVAHKKEMVINQGHYIYSRKCKDWRSDDPNKMIEKLGCTNWIEYRKWWGATERLHPCYYKWYLVINDLGRFKSIKSIEQTIFRHSFFSNRRKREGAGTEYFELNNYEDSCRKACEILVQYCVVFKVIKGDPFKQRPRNLPKEEKISYDSPLPPITMNIEQEQPKKKELRPYQETCIGTMMNVLIGIIVGATGIGKTVIMSAYIKQKGGKYLIVVPTQQLVEQTIDKCQEELEGASFYVSNYKNRNRNRNRNRNNKNSVIVGTYQNSHKLRNIQGIDCILFDECHSTVILKPPKDPVGKRIYSRFQKLLAYKCERKFFFTATVKNIISSDQKISSGEIISSGEMISSGEKIISMDDENVYGPVIFRYDLATAINEGYLCDYSFHLVATTDKINSSINYVKTSFKSVIFCAYQETLENVYEELNKKLPESILICKLGENENVKDVTTQFSEYNGQAVIISVRKIAMGYDEKQIDTIIHYDLSTSSIANHQKNGRGFRLDENKVMARLAFLCDISGTEEDRKEKIKLLHRPVAYMKSIDKRFGKRLDREQMKSNGEFKTVDVVVDGEFEKLETKEIYDRCWRTVNDTEISYQKAKDIIKLSTPRVTSWKQYLELCDRDSRLYINPENKYKGQFEDRVEYLGLERIYSMEKIQNLLEKNKQILKPLYPDLHKICENLKEIDNDIPSVDIICDYYKSSLDQIIHFTKKGKRLQDLLS